jgi:hypothetical protein
VKGNVGRDVFYEVWSEGGSALRGGLSRTHVDVLSEDQREEERKHGRKSLTGGSEHITGSGGEQGNPRGSAYP